MIVIVVAVSACATNQPATPDPTPEQADAGGTVGDETDAGVTVGDEAEADIIIGVSFGQNVHPFFVAMQLGIEQAAQDLGIGNLMFLEADGSLETQVTQIEDLVTMGANVILLNPIDSDGVVNAVQHASDNDVKIITIDIDCDGSDAFVASNNYLVGQMLAEYVIEALDGEGEIAMIAGIAVTSLRDRREGFMNGIAGTNIEIVAEQHAAMQRADSLEAAETILQAHPNIQAFVGVNENSAMGILSAVTAAGRLDDILITTVDATSENLVAIRDDLITVGVSQDPYMMGYLAVELALRMLGNEAFDAFTEVPVSYMTIDNVEEFITRERGYGVEID